MRWRDWRGHFERNRDRPLSELSKADEIGLPAEEGAGPLRAALQQIRDDERPVSPLPRHIGIIMDGNGRWATRRGLARVEGHRQGAEAVRRVVRAAREMGVPALTLYAFSTENWGRPTVEVAGLMTLLAAFLRDEREELLGRGIRLHALGERDRLPAGVRELLTGVERATAGNRGLILSLALSYGGREAIVAAARRLAQDVAAGRLAPEALDAARFQAALGTAPLPPLDLVIRTSGEQRLSNFMLWEVAYAELHFTPVLWPDFGPRELEDAVAAFLRRRRRFGLCGADVAATG